MTFDEDRLKTLVTICLGNCPVCDADDLVNDLGADSMDLFSLAGSIEEEYGIEITDPEIVSAETYGDLKDLIKSRLRV